MYRYIIVATNGRSWPIFGSRAEFEAASSEDLPECSQFALPDLLESGWNPVREVPIGEKFALVLLRREPEWSNGKYPSHGTSG